MDDTDRIPLKMMYKKEIRRISFTANNFTYRKLSECTRQLFQIESQYELYYKYMDDEQEEITFSTNSELLQLMASFQSNPKLYMKFVVIESNKLIDRNRDFDSLFTGKSLIDEFLCVAEIQRRQNNFALTDEAFSLVKDILISCKTASNNDSNNNNNNLIKHINIECDNCGMFPIIGIV